jgi:hypothetical protein
VQPRQRQHIKPGSYRLDESFVELADLLPGGDCRRGRLQDVHCLPEPPPRDAEDERLIAPTRELDETNYPAYGLPAA